MRRHQHPLAGERVEPPMRLFVKLQFQIGFTLQIEPAPSVSAKRPIDVSPKSDFMFSHNLYLITIA